MSIAAELLFWLLGIFFLYGAINNFLARGNLRETYRQWGYPEGFHLVTAGLEFIAAILLVFPSTRIFGAALASCVMIAATATLLRAGLHKPAIIPAIVLAFSSLGIAVAYVAAPVA
ncbi:DoxX family protein [Agrobacterium tumefaciens]|uniref:DoxX family protein n=1 Tax=Agrobacterium tumefaciens TaxID=358 RepID=UPI003BA0E768